MRHRRGEGVIVDLDEERERRRGEGEEQYCFGNCGRPATEAEYLMCREHRTLVDADSKHMAWEVAMGVLRPWVEAARAISFDELTELMEEALAKGEKELARAQCKTKEAERAVGKA